MIGLNQRGNKAPCGRPYPPPPTTHQLTSVWMMVITQVYKTTFFKIGDAIVTDSAWYTQFHEQYLVKMSYIYHDTSNGFIYDGSCCLLIITHHPVY